MKRLIFLGSLESSMSFKKRRDKTDIYVDIMRTLMENPLPITQLRQVVNLTYVTLYHCLRSLESAGYITITITRDELTGFRRGIKFYEPTREGVEFISLFDRFFSKLA